MNQNAVAYIRVSTDEQAQFGVSLAAQEDRVRAYATMQRLSLVAVIREEGVSAGRPLASRPGGQELLSVLAAGRAQHVVAMKLDRLFRDTVDCLLATRTWDKQGVAFHIIDMGGQTLNTASAIGRMFLTMCAGFAELERGLIAERTRTAMQHLRTLGRTFGAPRLGENESEQATVTRIVALKAQGLSLRAIGARLQDEGFQTKKGGRWAPATLKKVLAREACAQADNPRVGSKPNWRRTGLGSSTRSGSTTASPHTPSAY